MTSVLNIQDDESPLIGEHWNQKSSTAGTVNEQCSGHRRHSYTGSYTPTAPISSHRFMSNLDNVAVRTRSLNIKQKKFISGKAKSLIPREPIEL